MFTFIVQALGSIFSRTGGFITEWLPDLHAIFSKVKGYFSVVLGIVILVAVGFLLSMLRNAVFAIKACFIIALCTLIPYALYKTIAICMEKTEQHGDLYRRNVRNTGLVMFFMAMALVALILWKPHLFSDSWNYIGKIFHGVSKGSRLR